MSAALEALGIPCWHSLCLLSTHFADNEMWQEAIDLKFFRTGSTTKPPFGRAEFDQLLHGFGAVSSDTPAIAFAEELLAAYPEARVVLVERELEPWLRSYLHSIVGNAFHPAVDIVYRLDRWYVGVVGRTQRRVLDGWMGIRSGDLVVAEQRARAMYPEHYALVRRLTEPERLLEFRLEDGWEPLCAFLGKEVPDSPFPRLNEKKWLDEKISIITRRGITTVAAKVAWIVVPVLLAVIIWLKV